MKRSIVMKLIVLVIVSSCSADEIDYGALESSQPQFDVNQTNTKVLLMPIEQLFPDSVARALAEAATEGRLHEMEKLVSQGANVNYRGAHGATVLFWAIREQSIDGFRKLLELGADPNLTFDKSSVMHWAARLGDTEYLSLALQYGGDPNLQAGTLEETPIFETIGIKGSDNQQARKLLADAGANLNAKTGQAKVLGMSMGGITPLMTAADLARFDVVYELIELGADPTLKDDNGRGLEERALSMRSRFPKDSAQEYELEKVLKLIKK